MAEYLFEIGCEELPPKASNILRQHFFQFFSENFKQFFSTDSPENIKIFSTPRRLAVYLKNLLEKAPSEKITLVGPPYKVAVDDQGKFTKAAISFAQKNNLPLELLQKIQTDKGEYIGAVLEKEGKLLAEFIKEIVPKLFDTLPSLKSMRWNNTNFRFPRPIRWIVSLLDDRVVEITVAGINSCNYTHLHRFMTKPAGRGEKREIPHPSVYEEILKLGFIIPSFEERKKSIQTQLEGFARTLSAQPVLDQELIDQVTDLTEFPVGILGDFSPEYLIMPEEVIITVCKHHQRYFNFKKDDKLIPKFLAVSNNPVKDRDVIKKGFEKVLKARLEDALFFYKEDLKKKLDEHIPKLKNVQFHEKLGSVYEKVQRNLEIAKKIANLTGYTDTQKLERACWLSKADLLTEMVKEFDELQGIMGMHYAIKQGEEEEIAKAIFEHYLPRTSEDQLPQTKLGSILALADKLDTVISFISIGEIPKASADPFGIRRNAIGIVRILINNGIDLDLKDVVDKQEVLDFIGSRLESFLQSEGYSSDIVKSVMAVNPSNLYDVYRRLQALNQIKALADYEKVIMLFKRVVNIVPQEFYGYPDEKLFEKQEEKELFKQVNHIKDKFQTATKEKDYTSAINYLLSLKPYIDNFFDNVMVMVEDENLRNNRLAILSQINDMFKKLADFTKIIGG